MNAHFLLDDVFCCSIHSTFLFSPLFVCCFFSGAAAHTSHRFCSSAMHIHIRQKKGCIRQIQESLCFYIIVTGAEPPFNETISQICDFSRPNLHLFFISCFILFNLHQAAVVLHFTDCLRCFKCFCEGAPRAMPRSYLSGCNPILKTL